MYSSDKKTFINRHVQQIALDLCYLTESARGSTVFIKKKYLLIEIDIFMVVIASVLVFESIGKSSSGLRY